MSGTGHIIPVTPHWEPDVYQYAENIRRQGVS